MDDDFTDAPVTIGELRADRSRSCADWSPRDALITLLRDIDAGKADVGSLIVVYRVRNGEETSTKYIAATPTGIETLGMLTRALYMINGG